MTFPKGKGGLHLALRSTAGMVAMSSVYIVVELFLFCIQAISETYDYFGTIKIW